MGQELYTISLLLNEKNKSLELDLHPRNDLLENRVLLIGQNQIDRVFLGPWLISNLKSLLIDCSPDAKIIFNPINLNNPIEEIKVIWETIENIVYQTQKLKKEWNNKYQVDPNYNAVLYIGENNLFNSHKAQSVRKTFFHKLIDKKNGEFDCFNTEQVLNFIQNNKIALIYVVGPIFFAQNLTRDLIYIPAVLKWIGVQLSIVDCDNYNEMPNGYFIKQSFSFKNSKRLSILPQIDKPWDKLLKVPSISYYCLQDPESMEATIKQPSHPSKLILTSHSRIYEIRNYLKPALLLLEYTDEKNILYDFQLLFHTLYYLLHNQFEGTLVEKMELSHYLSKAYYNVVNLMKYEVLEQLNSEKKMELYGDEGWSLLFPQHYQGKYLNYTERDELIRSGNYTYIIPAFNFSYYANNPLYGEVFNLNCPYICFPSIVSNEHTAGLKHLEFSNMIEMNQKIYQTDRILTEFKNEISASRKYLKEIKQICRDETVQYLFSDNQDPLTYDALTTNMLNDFEDLVLQYLSLHSQKVFECFNRFTRKDFENLNPMHSKLANRKHLNIILNQPLA